MKKSTKIELGDPAEPAKEFIDAWRRAEQGGRVVEKYRLQFENLETLLKALTPGRWVLLKVLHQKGPASTRALADWLARDYETVHRDVKRLEEIGLIERVQGKVTVPWDIVEARLDLDAQ